MAIFGPYLTVRSQLATDARFVAALRYVADVLDPHSAAYHRINRLLSGASERIQLPAGAFALEQVYHSKPRREVFLESHRKYIDVQVIVAGAECMEVQDITRLNVSQAYLEERDLIKYEEAADISRLSMTAGNVAVFFPADGHLSAILPEVGPVLVRKSVVKVPLE